MKPVSRDETDILKMRSYFYAKIREKRGDPERSRRIWNIQRIRWNRLTKNGTINPYQSPTPKPQKIVRIVERLKVVVKPCECERMMENSANLEKPHDN